VKYLLDTVIVSELRKRSGDPRVKAWVGEQASSELAISVITVIEIETGILLVRRRDPAQADLLANWLERQVLNAFRGRVVELDLPTARRVPPLHVPDPAPQHDALIAATALEHALTVVTLNVRDFTRTGVEVFDPTSQ
jgi:toxin FitB